MTDRAARLILVRHAATADTGHRYCGASDPPLSAAGRAQAAALADRLADWPVDAVLSSPLRRAADTAAAVADRLGVPVNTTDALREAGFGAWEGLTYDEIAAEWPDEVAAWLADLAVAPPGGESFAAVARRVLPVLAAARGTVLVVGHASLVKLALHGMLGLPRPALDAIQVAPASLSIMDTWPTGGPSLVTLNDVAHLSRFASALR